MEEEQIICCCGSSTWTRVIGWFHLLLSIIGIIYFALQLADTVAKILSRDDETVGVNMSPEGRELLRVAVALAAVVFTFALCMFLNIILLQGSYNKKPKYLKAWIVGSVIVLFLLLLIRLLHCIYSAKKGACFRVFIPVLVIEGFFIRAVNTYKKELEAASSHHPVPYSVRE